MFKLNYNSNVLILCLIWSTFSANMQSKKRNIFAAFFTFPSRDVFVFTSSQSFHICPMTSCVNKDQLSFLFCFVQVICCFLHCFLEPVLTQFPSNPVSNDGRLKLIFISGSMLIETIVFWVETKMEAKFYVALLILGLVSTALGKFLSKCDIESIVRVVAQRKKTKLSLAQAN